jgi:hypothetical protein
MKLRMARNRGKMTKKQIRRYENKENRDIEMVRGKTKTKEVGKKEWK